MDALICSTNVNVGKPSRRGREVLAQDVLSIGLGLDAVGDNHLGMGDFEKT